MKKLQKNFTTPEQSKRLLELGLPKDSADCCIHKSLDMIVYMNGCTYTEYVEKDGYRKKRCIPCWSVGRLIEILCKCMPSEIDKPKFRIDNNIIDALLGAIELGRDYGIDFSKLEE